RDDPELYVFYDYNGRDILFVQERIRKNDGKIDLPWSYWSDNNWYMMEPGGDLPLFGLEYLSGFKEGVVFIHEGAKTASYVQFMTSQFDNDLRKTHPWLSSKCPWFEVLKDAAHLGWPGGAPNPHRVDWGPIAKLSLYVKIYIVADNDRAGEDAV